MSTDLYQAPESIDPAPEPRLQRKSKIIPLLVLIAIMPVMFVLTKPAYDGARTAAIRAQCASRLDRKSVV